MKLRDYPTLDAVIGFVRANRPDLGQPTTDDRPQTTASNPQAATPAVVSEPSFVVATVDPVAGKVLQSSPSRPAIHKKCSTLTLDMEADLGIDTVKQAETFLAIRQAFDIPRRDDMKLRDYPTLGAVIGFVRDNQPDLAQPSLCPAPDAGKRSRSAVAAPPAATAAAGDPIADKVLQIVAEQTGYPQDMLELDLDMESRFRD